MSLPFLHSSAEIIAKLLQLLGLAAAPPATPWPVYYSKEPSSPDNVITCYDTQGRNDGSIMVDGEQQDNPGVQLRFRGATHAAAYVKAEAVAKALDEAVSYYQVALPSAVYIVHNVLRVGNIIALGPESPTSERLLFTVNLIVTIVRRT